MITRPLDLASRLRDEPRSLDPLFYVNVGLIALLFIFFGSRFVLSPGLGLDFDLPRVAADAADSRVTSHVVTVVNGGQILVGDGYRNVEQFEVWLKEQSKTDKHPSLLVRADADVQYAILARIVGLAHANGYSVTLAVEQAARPPEAATSP